MTAVRGTIEALAALPTCHLEVTTPVVPGLSDDEAQIDAIASRHLGTVLLGNV